MESRKAMGTTAKVCAHCKVVQPFSGFYKAKGKKDGLKSWCKQCITNKVKLIYHQNRESILSKNARWRTLNPVKTLLQAARRRATVKGILYNLNEADIYIPAICPVLGIPLIIEAGKLTGLATANSPSLDRVIPLLGYTKGNVRVISYRANTLKRDASLEEIEALALYMRVHGAP